MIGQTFISGNTNTDINNKLHSELYSINDADRGTALLFDGVDDYVELLNNTSYGFEASFSVELWIKAESMSEGYHTIAQKGTEWQLKVFATSGFYVFEFGINNNSIFSSLQLVSEDVIGKWIHLEGVVNQSSGSESTILYVNGISGTAESATAITTTSTKLKIGDLFKGEIDEFRVWNIARSQTQVREKKHLTSSPGDANITTYIQFNEGSGSTTTDIFGGNNGTLYNMNTSDAWLTSGVPAGDGVSNTQTETNGLVSFTGTGFTANYSSQSSAAVTVTKITGAPNVNPNLFDSQYWIIERYGSGNFTADYSFTVGESFTSADESTPTLIKLYRRSENSDTYWNFNNNANTVSVTNHTADFSNISDTGQFVICRRLSPDQFAGNAIFLNGTDDSITFGNNNNLNIENNITIEMWLKPDILNSNRRILAKGNNHFFEWDDAFESVSGKGIQIDIPALSTNWWEFQYDMNYNQWYHIAFTFSESGELKAYVNGSNVRTGTFTGNIGLNTNDLTLCPLSYESPLYGQVDELRIWNKVRSQTEIQENMCSTLSGLEQGLISYWQFNESEGSTLPDLVGGNDGTLNNMDNTNWVSSQAPLPFITTQDGNWDDNATWLPGQNYPDSPWSKVRISHSINLSVVKEVRDLSITSSGTLDCSPTTQLNVSDSLNNESGNDGLVLNSDATNTASLISSNSNISGQAETYISSGQWHFVSSPVSTATVEDFYFPGSTTSWIKSWDEVSNDWVYISNISTLLNVGQGYATWFESAKSDETVVYSGTFNAGDLNKNLSYSGTDRGFNLVGNPFPSSLDWDIGSWENNNTTSIAYVWNNGNYLSRNSIGEGSLTNGIIPAGQGFFVQASATNASITIPQDARVLYNQIFYKNHKEEDKSDESSYLQLTVDDGNKRDKTWISFNKYASNEWDEGIDALRLAGDENQPQLYTKYDNEQLSIQSFEVLSSSFSLPLYFITPDTKQYSLQFDFIESFENTEIWLEDKKDNFWFPISESKLYYFTANPYDDDHRFTLHFFYGTTTNGPDYMLRENSRVWFSNGNLNIDMDENLGKLQKVEVYNLSGQIIYSVVNPDNNSFRINRPKISSCVIVKIQTQQSVICQKVIL